MNFKNIKKLNALSLSEVLITIALLGVVASLTIPIVISYTEEKTNSAGVRKAINVINEAININVAKGYKSPYYVSNTSYKDGSGNNVVVENNLFEYLQKNLNVVATTDSLQKRQCSNAGQGGKSFMTGDKMRYIFLNEGAPANLTPNDSDEPVLNFKQTQCGIKGLKNAISDNPHAYDVPPCLIMVDTNGDKCPNKYTFKDKLTDVFFVVVTDSAAFPYGKAAWNAYRKK